MDRTGISQDDGAFQDGACLDTAWPRGASADRARGSIPAAEARLERSVADALRIIAAACAERNAAPVKAARRQLGAIYGATRLSRRRERGASA